MNEFTINIEKQLSRLGRDIQEFVEKVVPVHQSDGDFSPMCDIVEGKEEYKILLDLPGLSKKDIRITLKDRVLTISGERELNLEEGDRLKRNERKSGAFSRSFALPEEIETDDTEAQFRNGVLTVSMPKLESSEDAQSIPIK